MKQFSKIITGLFICLTVGACSSESDSKKAIDNVNRSIAQTKRDIDKIAEDAKKQADKARGNNLDLTSSNVCAAPSMMRKKSPPNYLEKLTLQQDHSALNSKVRM